MPSPNKEAPRRAGGANFHKNPDCACSTCSARRRKAETVALRLRADSFAVDPSAQAAEVGQELIHADRIFETGPYTKENKGRATIAKWVEIRAAEPDLTSKEIAKRIGVTPGYLYTMISKSTREGWLKFDEPMARLEHEIIPKVVDNLVYFLDAKDQKVTIETAKGTLFKMFAEAKGLNEQQTTVLAIKLEMPPGFEGGGSQIAAGKIVGKPKTFVDADLVEVVKES